MPVVTRAKRKAEELESSRKKSVKLDEDAVDSGLDAGASSDEEATAAKTLPDLEGSFIQAVISIDSLATAISAIKLGLLLLKAVNQTIHPDREEAITKCDFFAKSPYPRVNELSLATFENFFGAIMLLGAQLVINRKGAGNLTGYERVLQEYQFEMIAHIYNIAGYGNIIQKRRLLFGIHRVVDSIEPKIINDMVSQVYEAVFKDKEEQSGSEKPRVFKNQLVELCSALKRSVKAIKEKFEAWSFDDALLQEKVVKEAAEALEEVKNFGVEPPESASAPHGSHSDMWKIVKETKKGGESAGASACFAADR